MKNAKLQNWIGPRRPSRSGQWKVREARLEVCDVRFPEVAATQPHLPTTPLCGGRKRSSEIFQKFNFGFHRSCRREDIGVEAGPSEKQAGRERLGI